MIESPIGRKLALITALKLAALCLIYFLFFGPRSAGPVDPAAHIAGQLPPPTIQEGR